MINPVVQNYLANTGQMFIKAAESEDPVNYVFDDLVGRPVPIGS